jgi:hypothetical protein
MPESTPPSPVAPRWPFWPVLALLCIAWVGFCWPWLSGRVTVPWDAKAHFYPQLVFLAQALHRGESFLWAPYVFSGAPQIADPQSLIFSPPHYLLAWLNGAPGFAAADAVPFAALLAGAITVALYFRDRGWHPAGAVVAGIAFMFGGSAAWRIQHVGQIMSLAYFPVVLLLIDRGLARSSLLYGAAAGVVAGFMVLGRDQVAGLAVLILIAYVLTHLLSGPDRNARIRAALKPLLAGIVAGSLVIVIPVAMTLVLASGSNRAYIDYDGAGRGSLHPAALITGFIANLFGTDGEFKQFWGPPSPLWGHLDLYVARNMSNVYSGALVMLALVFGAAGGGMWKSGARFFGLALVAMVLYALGRYTPFFRLFYDAIPGVDLFRRPADGTFLIGALAAYAAGHVVHVVASGETGFVTRAGRIVISATTAALLTGLALALAKGRLGYAWPMILEGAAWLIGSIVAVVLIRRRAAGRPMLAATLLGLLLTADLARNNGPNESTALPPAMFDVLRPDSKDPTIAFLKEGLARTGAPDRIDRVELAAIDFHWPNASLIHQLHHTLGYNPLRDARYAAAVGAGDHVALPDQRNFPPTFPSYASPLADLLGLRYIATAAPMAVLDKALPAGRLTEVARHGAVTIHENPRALPRVMVVPRAERADFEAIARSGIWPRTDFQDTTLFDPVPPGAAKGSRRGTARILDYSHRQITIEAEAPDGGFLVLNDPWHPWWSAYIDGYPTEIFRANLLFRAVQLPPGRFQVIFRFRPAFGLFESLTDKLSGRAPR